MRTRSVVFGLGIGLFIALLGATRLDAAGQIQVSGRVRVTPVRAPETAAVEAVTQALEARFAPPPGQRFPDRRVISVRPRPEDPTRFDATIYDASVEHAFELTLDALGRELSREPVPGQPARTLAEYLDATTIVRESPAFAPAIAAGKLQFYEPMPAVTVDASGRRLVNVGLVSQPVAASVLESNEIVSVHVSSATIVRYPAQAPDTSRAGLASCGPGTSDCSATVGTCAYYQISWPQSQPVWKLNIRHPKCTQSVQNDGTGLELTDVYYKGRLILKRAEMPVLNVKYANNTCGPYRDWLYSEDCFQATGNDVPSSGSGIRMATSAPSTLCESGNDAGNFRGVAIYDQGDALWLVTESYAGWYRYDMEWRLHLDGTIEPIFGFGATTNNCTCNLHVHHAYWRFEWAIDATISGGTDDPSTGIDTLERRRAGTQSTYDPISTEATFVRPTSSPASDWWRVKNPQSGNGYLIEPGTLDGSASGDSWGKWDVAALALNPNEINDPNTDESIEISPWLNGEALGATKRLVTWYHASYTHNDPGGTGEPCELVGPTLVPIVGDTTPPGPPSNLTPSISPGTVVLSWGAASDNVGVTQYNVHRSTTSGFTPSSQNKIGQTAATTYTDYPPGVGTYYYLVTAQDAAGNVGNPSNQATATLTNPGVPDLTLTKTHTGAFAQGQHGATYTLTATNSGTGWTAGTVTVADTLPTGLTATAFSGAGWTCGLNPASCSRSDALVPTGAYPPLTLTVDVAANAPSSVTNVATVSGGGETNTGNDQAPDQTTITPPPATITLVQHASKDAGVTTSSSLAFPSGNAAGNWIAVAIRAGNPGQVFTVTDSHNNTYKRSAQLNQTVDTASLALYYAEGVPAGANTVTVSASLTGGTLRFEIFEYSGVATASSPDGTPTMSEGTGTSANSGPTTTSVTGDLVVGLITTSSGSALTAGSGYTIEEGVPASPGTKLAQEDLRQSSPGAIAATATLGTGQGWGALVAAFKAASGGPAVPDMTLSKSHSGAFTQGQHGAVYTLIATNSGSGSTTGTVTMTDTLPAGLTPTGASGTGWSCSVTAPSCSCSRSDALAAGASYPAITLTVDVAANAASSVTNVATIAGGGESNTGNDQASDPTTINPPSSSSIALVQHASKDAGVTTSSSLAFPSANTAGNWIAVAVRAGNAGQTFTVTDTQHNTYKLAAQLNETLDTASLAVYYAESIGGGANTVTVSDSISGGTLRFAAFEYSGVAASGSADGAPAMAEGTGTAVNSGSTATSAGGDLVLGVVSSSSISGFTAGAGFTIEENVPAAPNTKLIEEDQIQSGAGPASATATLDGAQPWGAIVVAFRKAGS